jgi:hypothetical protein
MGQDLTEAFGGGGDVVAVADGDDHERDLGVAPKEPRALPEAVSGAVDTEQDGGAGDSELVEEVDDGEIRRSSLQPFLAPDVDRELGLLVPALVQFEVRDPPGQHAGTFEGDEPVVEQFCDFGQGALDASAGVNGDGDDGQVLREREQAIRLQVVLDAEAFNAAHDNAGLEGVAFVEVQERVSREGAVGAVALAEVSRELETVLVHGPAPPGRPSAAAPGSNAAPRAMLSAAPEL